MVSLGPSLLLDEADIAQEKFLSNDSKLIYNDVYGNIEYWLFEEDMLANHCLLHEIEIDFKCISKCL